VIGHDETGHDLTLDDMALHDFRHVGFVADPVPDTFRIDHDTGSHRTMVEATGFICPHQPFEIQTFRFALEMGVEFFRSPVGAAAARIILGPLIDADENVTLEWRHESPCLVRLA
jgi:hypothetical protein